MFVLVYSNLPDNLCESQCVFIDKLWISNSYFKYHRYDNSPRNAFLTIKLVLHKIFFCRKRGMQLTRHEILSTKTRGFCSPAFRPPQHCHLGGRFQWAGLHSSILARGLMAHTWQIRWLGKHTTAELTPLCTSEIKEGNANDEEVSFQLQMQVCLGQPSLKLSNKNYFSAVYIWGFLGALHLLSNLLCSAVSHACVLGQPGWDGAWSFFSSFPTPSFPACQSRLFQLMSAGPKSEDFSQTSETSWEKTKLLDPFLEMKLCMVSYHCTFQIPDNFSETSKIMTVSKIPFFLALSSEDENIGPLQF